MTKLEDIMGVIRKYAPNFRAKLGMILGSGLGTIADQITNPITIPFQAMGLTAGTISGHASMLVWGMLDDVPVACLKGRLHLYEGTAYESISALVRVLRHLGARTVIVTGAAGSLRQDTGPGELMMLTDHINFLPGNPLVGINDESIGPRFVSMENAYDPDLGETLVGVAAKLNIPLAKGVYLSTLGPSFETPAEIRAFRTLGADAIGMSIVPEVIVARHSGMHVLGIVAITNFAEGMSDEKVTHEGTLQFGAIASRNLVKLIIAFVKEAGPELAT
jgi:xanthosine phosphorylase